MPVIDLPSLHMTRLQLLEALEARRTWAERIDRKALTKHQRDEKAYMKAFQAACRTALKWDYDTVKENYGQIDVTNSHKRSRYRSFDAPECPLSIVAKLEVAIEFVRNDTRKTCVLSRNGEWAGVYWLLTYDPDEPEAALC